MTIPTKPIFAVGDIVADKSQVVGDKPSTVHWKILATYKNLNGWWHAVEAMTGIHVGDQDSIADNGNFSKVATTKVHNADMSLLINSAFSEVMSHVKKLLP